MFLLIYSDFFCFDTRNNSENNEDKAKSHVREACRLAQLFTLKPHGTKKRNELKSKRRINYADKEF